jgi:hypothetical protein
MSHANFPAALAWSSGWLALAGTTNTNLTSVQVQKVVQKGWHVNFTAAESI